MTVGLLGAPDDPQVATLARLLGAEARIIDSWNFPAKVPLTIRPPELRSIYVRQLNASPLVDDRGMKENWYGTMMAHREKGAFLTGWLLTAEEAGVRLVNSPRTEVCGNKPYQLALFRRAGIDVPDTLVTNDPEEVRAFAARHSRVIYKPVGGGATTRPLETRDLERLDLLRNAPVLFQEYIPGENVRVYVVGTEVVSSSVIETTDDYDFRRAEGKAVPCALPAPVRDGCVSASRVCGFAFTSIDIRRDGDRWAFLEANASPMWAGYDRKTDGRVGPALARFLTSA
jgi:glutathione synthase/RimK-type ligase-like ATP-grasp enzyme